MADLFHSPFIHILSFVALRVRANHFKWKYIIYDLFQVWSVHLFSRHQSVLFVADLHHFHRSWRSICPQVRTFFQVRPKYQQSGGRRKINWSSGAMTLDQMTFLRNYFWSIFCFGFRFQRKKETKKGRDRDRDRDRDGDRDRGRDR